MIPVFLATALILAALIAIVPKRGERENKKRSAEFWERERKANFVPKKDISNLDFITIPPCLSSPAGSVSEEIKDTEKRIMGLTDKKIVNFAGKTNTDLKMEYGTANFQLLSEYDSNYIKLVQLMQKYIRLLKQEGYDEKANEILEFARVVAPEVNSFKA